MENNNKYLLKFLYSFAGLFMGVYAALPVLIGAAWFFGVVFLMATSSFWWALTFILFITIIIAFGENIEDWIEDKWDDAKDLINKIDL